jgi:TP901 family phage tail tape measure protein
MSVIGTAEILIVPSTAGFDAALETESQAGFTGFAQDAEDAGGLAGANLRRGVTGETGALADDLASDGDKAGSAFASKVGTGSSKLTGVFSDLLGAVGVPIGGISSKVGEIGSAAESSAGTAGAAFGGMGGAFLAAGAVIAGVAIDFGVKMDDVDAKIAAAAGTSTDAAKKITDAFEGTAGSTEFSAAEMGTAYAGVAGQLTSMYGKALNADQALNLMKAATDLASASGTDLGTATSALVGIMQAFGLKTTDAAHASDILYNSSRDTGLGVDQVASSLDKLRGKLGDASPPLGALAALLVNMTNNGITGRAALTSVNTAMTGLIAAATGTTTANEAANTELQSLGVQAVNAKGQITPLSTVIGQLAPKFATMTKAQQEAAASTIFGASAAKDMVKVIDAGPAAYDKASASVNKMGSAHAAAALQESSLAGEGKVLMASLSDFASMLGQALVPALQVVIGVITTIISDFITFAGYIGTVVGAIGSLMNALGPVKDIVLGIVAAVAAWEVAQIALNVVLGLNPVVLIIAGIVALVVAIVELVKNFGAVKAAFSDAFNFMAGLAKTVASAIVGVFAPIVATISGFFTAIGNFVSGVWTTISSTASDLVNGVLGFFAGLPGSIMAAITGLPGSIGSAVWDPISSAVTGILSDINSAFGGLPGKILGALTVIPGQILSTVWNVIKDEAGTLISAIEDLFAGEPGKALNAILSLPGKLLNTIWTPIKSDASALISDVTGFFGGLPGKIGSAVASIANSFEKNVLAPIGNFVSTAIGDIVKFFEGLPAKIVNAVAAIPGDFLHLGEQITTSIINGIGDLAGSILDKIKGAVNSIPVVGSALSAIGLASGGIVTQPTFALVGEAGPEAVIPLSGGSAGGINVSPTGVTPLPSGAAGGGVAGAGGGVSALAAGDLNVNIYGSGLTAPQVVSELAWQLSNGALPAMPQAA